MLFHRLFPFFFLCLIGSLTNGVVAQTDQTAKVEKVVFEIHWTPQTQFAGFLVAKEKGFFKKHLPGPEVEIVWPGVKENPLDNLAKEKNRFCTCWLPDALYDRCVNPSRKIVCLAQVMQDAPAMLVTRIDSGIETPKDLDGKRVQVWKGGVNFMFQAFFDKQGVKPILVPQGGSMMPFVYGTVPVASAMYYNEYHVLLERGFVKENLRTFSLGDYGLSFPGDGIYSSKETWDAAPDLCRKIVEASHEGWNYAIAPENETEVLDLVLAYARRADVITSRSHQRWMLQKIKENLELDSKKWGILKRADFDRILEIIRQSETVKNDPSKKFPSYEEFSVTR